MSPFWHISITGQAVCSRAFAIAIPLPGILFPHLSLLFSLPFFSLLADVFSETLHWRLCKITLYIHTHCLLFWPYFFSVALSNINCLFNLHINLLLLYLCCWNVSSMRAGNSVCFVHCCNSSGKSYGLAYSRHSKSLLNDYLKCSFLRAWKAIVLNNSFFFLLQM